MDTTNDSASPPAAPAARAAEAGGDDDPEPAARSDLHIEDHHFVRPTVRPIAAAGVRISSRDG
jgi:hypothetical protein